jgi:hypothetical protein
MSREEFQKKADAVIKVMLEADATKPERLLPVYDIQGNLIWPEKITYENVKKLIEQRDTNV